MRDSPSSECEQENVASVMERVLTRLQSKKHLTPTQEANIRVAVTSQAKRQSLKKSLKKSQEKKEKKEKKKQRRLQMSESPLASQLSIVTSSVSHMSTQTSPGLAPARCGGGDDDCSSLSTSTSSDTSSDTTSDTSLSAAEKFAASASAAENHSSFLSTAERLRMELGLVNINSMTTEYSGEVRRVASRSTTLMNDVQDVKILNFEKIDGHIRYRIGLSINGGTSFMSTATKRFRQFVELDHMLRLGLSSKSQRKVMPALPSKTFMTWTNDVLFLQRRLHELQCYLSALVRCPHVAHSQALKSFISQSQDRIVPASPTPTCWGGYSRRFESKYERVPSGWK